jgi:hypothetical protein
VAQQRVVAGEGGLVGLASEAGAIVGDNGDRREEDVDDLAGVLVDQYQAANEGLLVSLLSPW